MSFLGTTGTTAYLCETRKRRWWSGSLIGTTSRHLHTVPQKVEPPAAPDTHTHSCVFPCYPRVVRNANQVWIEKIVLHVFTVISSPYVSVCMHVCICLCACKSQIQSILLINSRCVASQIRKWWFSQIASTLCCQFPNPCLRTRKGKETWLKQHEINHAEIGSKAHFTLGLLSFFQLEFRVFLWLGCWQVEKKTWNQHAKNILKHPLAMLGLSGMQLLLKTPVLIVALNVAFTLRYGTKWEMLNKQTTSVWL